MIMTTVFGVVMTTAMACVTVMAAPTSIVTPVAVAIPVVGTISVTVMTSVSVTIPVMAAIAIMTSITIVPVRVIAVAIPVAIAPITSPVITAVIAVTIASITAGAPVPVTVRSGIGGLIARNGGSGPICVAPFHAFQPVVPVRAGGPLGAGRRVPCGIGPVPVVAACIALIPVLAVTPITCSAVTAALIIGARVFAA